MPAADEREAIVRGVWDAAARTYDETWGHGLRSELEARAWAALLARLLPPERPVTIADIGCGTGVIALTLAELGHSVVAVDFSEAMLEVCGEAAARRGLTNVRLVPGEAEHPPAGVGPVDAVVSRHLLWTLFNPEAAVRAWVGLVRPGGRVLAFDALWSGPIDFHHYPDRLDLLLPLLHVASLDPLRNLWRRAGLVEVMAEELRWIDRVERLEMPEDQRRIWEDHAWYLVEGTRPSL
jgi:ubiquinone/menaquinone biosynthesis C-methylase UbiE